VRSISRSRWNDGYGADSALPEAIFVGVLSAQLRQQRAIRNVGFTSIRDIASTSRLRK
jgi:hypothetical protein